MLDKVTDDNLVVDARGAYRWRELRAQAKARFTALQPGQRAAFLCDSAGDALLAAARLVSGDLDGTIVRTARADGPLRHVLDDLGFARVMPSGEVTAASDRQPAVPGRITLFTSGSTGTPKPIAHTWASLHTLSGHNLTPNRWLVPYELGSYAWFQLVTVGLFHADQTLAVPDSLAPAEAIAFAARANVTAISATPTFWRLAWLGASAADLDALRPTQLTLGGELVDQPVLDALRRRYPDARASWIYASTEAGASLVVHDGQAGFPATWLDGERLRIVDGVLELRTSSAAASLTGQWHRSGDLVEQREDRVHFVGRSDGAMINVGGQKAWPGDVTARLLAHPAVAWARVRARRAPLVGHLAAADLVLATPLVDAEATLTQWCSAALPAYAVPRSWSFLDAIPVSTNLKSEL